MAQIDLSKLITGVAGLVDQVKAANADGKVDISEVFALLSRSLQVLADAGVNTGEAGQVLSLILPLVVFIANRK